MFTETLAPIYQTTLHHTPEDRNPYLTRVLLTNLLDSNFMGVEAMH
jgi:hypothetical protein